jgi:sterol 24-C-methyltransferase
MTMLQRLQKIKVPELTPQNVLVGVACLVVLQPVASGIAHTLTFISSLTGRQQARIDKYNELHSADGAKGREDDYSTLVDSYYDLATNFYEWGWGSSFHFASRCSYENFRQSILRHEHYLAGKLQIMPGAHVLDCGCGIGGPARNIHRFTGAKITAVTLNHSQVNRGNVLCKQEGVAGMVELVQADFMKLPFADNTFDAVFAIESTCHAPDRNGVYSEILRVLKPGGVFACYEWCLTDTYDAGNALHRTIKKDIEVGDGLPDIVHTSVCTRALKTVGFEILETRDVALDKGFHLEAGDPWYHRLTSSWHPLDWPRFQFNPVMYRLMPLILGFLELFWIVPKGTRNTQIMLQAGGRGCALGGSTGVFTPMWLMVGKKPK